MNGSILRGLSAALLSACTVTAYGGGSTVTRDLFYLLEAQNYTLLSAERSNPAATSVVGSLPIVFWSDLANGTNPDELLAVDVDARAIVRLSTLDAAVLGQTTISRDIRNLASDGPGGRIWGLPQTGPLELFQIDLASGEAATIGLTGIAESAFETVGLGYDPLLDRLLATTSTGRVYSIDPATAATELLAQTAFNSLFDVAYSFFDGEMYATDAASDSLYHLDRATGALTLVGGPYDSSPRATGLAFAVPEPASLLLLALGTAAVRRRRSC